MSSAFNAEEVYGIACQIERNGARFYNKAAETVSESEYRTLLKGLAEMEVNHEETFERMRNKLKQQRPEYAAYDPDNVASRYLEAFARGKVFDLNADPVEFLEANSGIRAILRKAIELEKETIVFYNAIESSMPGAGGRDEVRTIIGQEMGHVLMLTDELLAIQDQ